MKLKISIDIDTKKCVRDVPNGTSQSMKFFYVYVLRSLLKNYIYVGFTVDLKKRLIEHNSKKELSTKPYAPFELIHYEAYRNQKYANRREKYFKTTKGKITLKFMLKEFFSLKGRYENKILQRG